MPFQDQILIPVGRLQLVFQWQGDRFGHRLELASNDAAAIARQNSFLDSVEGSPDDSWPASPPLQECHVEPRPDGRMVALLVGRAGKSHWSLSVLCDPAASSLRFEVACRLMQEPIWLGSRYRVDDAVVVASDVDVVGSTEKHSPKLLVEAKPTGQRWRLCLPPSRSDKPAARPGELAFPAIQQAGIGTRTVQWSYHLQLVD